MSQKTAYSIVVFPCGEVIDMASFKTINNSDHNLFFHTARGKFIEPQRKTWFVPSHAKRTGRFDVQAKWTDFPAISGSGDKNIQFQMYQKGLKRKQPELKRRTFKDLDPKTRMMHRLDLTKRQRHNTLLLQSMRGIEKRLKDYVETPELDSDGVPVINPRTGETQMVLRSAVEQLRAGHLALGDAFRVNNIQVNANLQTVINMGDLGDIKHDLLDINDVLIADPDSDTKDREARIKAVPLLNRLANAEKIDDPVEQKVLRDEVIDQNLVPDPRWSQAGFIGRYFSPQQWLREKKKFMAFTEARLQHLGDATINVNGQVIGINQYGMQFSLGHWYDLQDMGFLRPGIGEIKAEERNREAFGPGRPRRESEVGIERAAAAGRRASAPGLAFAEAPVVVGRDALDVGDFVPVGRPAAAEVKVDEPRRAALELMRERRDIVRTALATPVARGGDQTIKVRTALVRQAGMTIPQAQAFMRAQFPEQFGRVR